MIAPNKKDYFTQKPSVFSGPADSFVLDFKEKMKREQYGAKFAADESRSGYYSSLQKSPRPLDKQASLESAKQFLAN